MEAKTYNQLGKETGQIKLSEGVFGLKMNSDLLHQVVRTMELNKRTPLAHTKGISEVSGTGKKPWRQKGTGRARHGTRRSPLWRTGGISHGPIKDKDYSGKISKKMRAKALYVALSQKLKAGEILFVDALNFEKPATNEARNILANLSKINGYEKILTKRVNSAFVSLGRKDSFVEKSFNNFGNVEIGETRSINPLDILKYKYLVIVNPEESVRFLESRLTSKKKDVSKSNEKAPAKAKIKKSVGVKAKLDK